jgi:hypothetical protein
MARQIDSRLERHTQFGEANLVPRGMLVSTAKAGPLETLKLGVSVEAAC